MSLAAAFLLYGLFMAVAYLLIDPHLLWRKPWWRKGGRDG